MKTIPLSELLTPEQLDQVAEILNSTPDPLERTRKLRSYLSKFKTQLEAKGIIPDYLAYAIPFAVANSPVPAPEGHPFSRN